MEYIGLWCPFNFLVTLKEIPSKFMKKKNMRLSICKVFNYVLRSEGTYSPLVSFG